MARTTGLVTVGCVLAWAQEALFSRGVHPPENLASDTINLIIERLRDDGVSIVHTTNHGN